MISFGTGLFGLIFLVPALFIMFSRSGAKWILPLMWVFLGIDLLFGSWIFALIQGMLLFMVYSRRKAVASPTTLAGLSPTDSEPPPGWNPIYGPPLDPPFSGGTSGPPTIP